MHDAPQLRLCATALSAIVMTFALQGCLLTRVFDSRAQLCDQRPPRMIVTRPPGSGLRVVFETPTLTDRDVGWTDCASARSAASSFAKVDAAAIGEPMNNQRRPEFGFMNERER